MSDQPLDALVAWALSYNVYSARLAALVSARELMRQPSDRAAANVPRPRRLQRKDVPVELVLAYARDWAAQSNRPGSVSVVERLVADGFPPKVALAKVNQLVDRGLLECGTSPEYAWPTRLGLTVLRDTQRGSA